MSRDHIVNFLEETREKLKDARIPLKDVLWVGLKDGSRTASWEEFEKLADFTYDSGYGGAVVNQKLVVVFNGGWLERHEYDGMEWWVVQRPPVKRPTAKPLRASDLEDN
jgi:hypothetical protein